MHNYRHIFAKITLTGCLLVLLFGCAELGTKNSADTGSDKESTSHYRFSDVPIPAPFKLDREKSFVYEAGASKIKIGRLIYTGYGKLDELAAFYQNEMPKSGWTLVRTIEQSGIGLLYEKQGWSCLVNLSSSFFQSTVEIQLGPK